jgi:hypothetical protein
MIVLTRCPLSEVEALVEVAFKVDAGLPAFHVTGGDLKECVADTCSKIKEASTLIPGMKLYAVNDLTINQTIGFTVVGAGLLYSFGIGYPYRDKGRIREWWNAVLLKIPSFKCYLWNKNTRAINFLLKNGARVEEQNNEYTKLDYQKEEI